MSAAPRDESLAARLTSALGTVVAAMGGLHLALWTSGLLSSHLGPAPMPVLTAVGLLLTGLGLAWSARRPAHTVIPGSATVLLGAAILVRHAQYQLFPPVGLTEPAGALLLLGPSPTTGLCFLLAGFALIVGRRRDYPTWRPATVATLGSTTVALALVNILVHAIRVGNAGGLEHLTGVAPLSACGLLLLGLGIMGTAASISAQPATRGPMWLPVSIGLGLAVFTFVVWRVLTVHEQVRRDLLMDTTAAAVRSLVESDLNTEAETLTRMARLWERGGGTRRDLWEADAAAHLDGQSGILDMLWIPPGGDVRWRVPGRTPAASIASILQNPVAARPLQTARLTDQTTITSTLALDDRNRVFLIYAPIHIGERDDGVLAVLLDVHGFLNNTFSQLRRQGYQVGVREHHRTVYGPTPDLVASGGKYGREIRLDVSGLSWLLRVYPAPGNPVRLSSPLPEGTLVVGLVLAALVTLTVHLGQTSLLRADDLERMNAELEQRVEARTAEVSRALRELERSNHDLEQFAYVASHDLQEPLRMVSSYLQLLARRYRGRLDEDADAFIGYAVDGAERMKRLINDLLSYARLGARTKPFGPVDCNTVLEGVRTNLALQLQESQAELQADPLPTVTGDPTLLLQLFQNLIGNALKFRGKEAPRVSLSAEKAGAFWTFRVRDNGIGLDPECAERIFVIFGRLHTQSEYPGTGIGLALCKKIVERHGGRIGVDSSPGTGSTFWFTLPA